MEKGEELIAVKGQDRQTEQLESDTVTDRRRSISFLGNQNKNEIEQK